MLAIMEGLFILMGVTLVQPMCLGISLWITKRKARIPAILDQEAQSALDVFLAGSPTTRWWKAMVSRNLYAAGEL